MIEEREGEGEMPDTRPGRRPMARYPGLLPNGWRKPRTRGTERGGNWASIAFPDEVRQVGLYAGHKLRRGGEKGRTGRKRSRGDEDGVQS